MTNYDCKNNCYNYKICKTLGNVPNDLAVFESCICYKDKYKIIELPCNYGEFVYFTAPMSSIDSTPIKAKIEDIRISSNGDIGYEAVTEYSGISRRFYSSQIGETVFLTKEEAEKAWWRLKYE